MRKAFTVLVTLVFALSIATAAFAKEMKGTIKGVDVKAGTVTFCPEGTTSHQVMEVEKGVDIKKIEPETKVEINVENDKVTDVKKIRKRRMIEGC